MSPKVIYVTFQGNSGMAHYAEALSQAMRNLTDAKLAMVAMRDELEAHTMLPGLLPFQWSEQLRNRRFLEGYNPLFYRKIARKLCSAGVPSIVHITSQVTGLLAFVKEIRRLGSRVIYTVHDPIPHDERRTTWGRIYEAYQRRYQLPEVLRLCAAVHVHSVGHREQLRTLYGESIASKAYIVPHGAGLSRNVAAGDREPVEFQQRVVGDAMTLLFFGRIEPYKGLDVLLDALKLVNGRGRNVQLIVAGAGRLGDDRGVASDPNVTLVHRFVPDEEVRKVFERADVVVLPYRSATQSGVIPMAYAFGKPVISTRVGALNDVVVEGKTGLLVKPGDPAALADAIEHLDSDRNLVRQMGKAAVSFLEQRLAWSKVADAHMGQYLAVIDQKMPDDVSHVQ